MTMTRADAERAFVDALGRGDPAAVERFVDVYADRAYGLAALVTGDKQVAEAVVQDAARTAMRMLSTFNGGTTFSSWFDRMVVNAAYCRLRGWGDRRSDVSVSDAVPVFDEPSPHGEPMADWSALLDNPSIQPEVPRVLTSAIGELPAHYRMALVLHDIERLSPREIGELLNERASQVRVCVHRARLFLRTRLGDSLTGATEIGPEHV